MATNWCGLKRASKLPSMNKSKILVFDTETTGLSPLTDEILQISILDGDGYTLFDSLICPEHHDKWPIAERINGISPSHVQGAPKFSEVLPQIQDLFDNATLIVGYNVSFDIGFVQANGVKISGKIFDVMNEFRHYKRVIGLEGKSRLVDCAAHFGISFAPHDSLSDATATLECFNALINNPDFNSNVYKPRPKKAADNFPAKKDPRPAKTNTRRTSSNPGRPKRRWLSLILFVIAIILLAISVAIPLVATGKPLHDIPLVIEAYTTAFTSLPAITWQLAFAVLSIIGVVLAIIVVVRFVLWIVHVIKEIKGKKR